jgi:hypothetical protein
MMRTGLTPAVHEGTKCTKGTNLFREEIFVSFVFFLVS